MHLRAPLWLRTVICFAAQVFVKVVERAEAAVEAEEAAAASDALHGVGARATRAPAKP
jgi:hypothetical protein